MREYLELDTTPYDEPCAQVGSEGYAENVKLECRAMISQLVRLFGQPPAGASLTVKSNAHDFGTYFEISVKYDDTSEEGSTYAYTIEGEFPAAWDDEARNYLDTNGYSIVNSEHYGNADAKWVNRAVAKQARKYSSYIVADFEADLNEYQETPEEQFIVSKTYKIFPEESAEAGDFSETDFVGENETWDRSDVVRELKNHGYSNPSASSLDSLVWVSTEPEVDYSDGSQTTYSLYLKDMSGNEITGEQWESLLTDAGLFAGMHLSSVKSAMPSVPTSAAEAIFAKFKAGKPGRAGNLETDGTTVHLHQNPIFKLENEVYSGNWAGWVTPTTANNVNSLASLAGIGRPFSISGGAPTCFGKPCRESGWIPLGNAQSHAANKNAAVLEYDSSGDPPNTTTATKEHAYELKELAKQISIMQGSKNKTIDLIND